MTKRLSKNASALVSTTRDPLLASSPQGGRRRGGAPARKLRAKTARGTPARRLRVGGTTASARAKDDDCGEPLSSCPWRSICSRRISMSALRPLVAAKRASSATSTSRFADHHRRTLCAIAGTWRLAEFCRCASNDSKSAGSDEDRAPPRSRRRSALRLRQARSDQARAPGDGFSPAAKPVDLLFTTRSASSSAGVAADRLRSASIFRGGGELSSSAA